MPNVDPWICSNIVTWYSTLFYKTKTVRVLGNWISIWLFIHTRRPPINFGKLLPAAQLHWGRRHVAVAIKLNEDNIQHWDQVSIAQMNRPELDAERIFVRRFVMQSAPSSKGYKMPFATFATFLKNWKLWKKTPDRAGLAAETYISKEPTSKIVHTSANTPFETRKTT